MAKSLGRDRRHSLLRGTTHLAGCRKIFDDMIDQQLRRLQANQPGRPGEHGITIAAGRDELVHGERVGPVQRQRLAANGRGDDAIAWSGSLRSALEKQLGLRLEPRRAPVEFLVIDRADKTPIEN